MGRFKSGFVFDGDSEGGRETERSLQTATTEGLAKLQEGEDANGPNEKSKEEESDRMEDGEAAPHRRARRKSTSSTLVEGGGGCRGAEVCRKGEKGGGRIKKRG